MTSFLPNDPLDADPNIYPDMSWITEKYPPNFRAYLERDGGSVLGEWDGHPRVTVKELFPLSDADKLAETEEWARKKMTDG